MLNVILETCAGTLTQGLIYAILSYGIFITYKILDFPDLTVAFLWGQPSLPCC